MCFVFFLTVIQHLVEKGSVVHSFLLDSQPQCFFFFQTWANRVRNLCDCGSFIVLVPNVNILFIVYLEGDYVSVGGWGGGERELCSQLLIWIISASLHNQNFDVGKLFAPRINSILVKFSSTESTPVSHLVWHSMHRSTTQELFKKFMNNFGQTHINQIAFCSFAGK